MRTPSERRTGARRRSAGWYSGANKNPKPTVSIAAAAWAGGGSMRRPSASSTSALPQRLDEARLPCLATPAPAAAATSPAAVEMLKVPALSPPVPQVSTRPARRTGVLTARWRSVVAKPTSSSTVSPRDRSAPMNIAACSGGYSSSSSATMAAAACSRDRVTPSLT